MAAAASSIRLRAISIPSFDQAFSFRCQGPVYRFELAGKRQRDAPVVSLKSAFGPLPDRFSGSVTSGLRTCFSAGHFRNLWISANFDISNGISMQPRCLREISDGKDEAALLRLWREKRGQTEPEDLSGNSIAQLSRLLRTRARSNIDKPNKTCLLSGMCQGGKLCSILLATILPLTMNLTL